MIADYEKILVIRDDKNRVQTVVVHTAGERPEFFNTSKSSMDDIKDLFQTPPKIEVKKET